MFVTRVCNLFSAPGNNAIAAGIGDEVAMKSDGTVWAWGDNRWGQLGNGTMISSDTPVQVNGLSSVIAIAANGRLGFANRDSSTHCLAIRSDGTTWAWGSNEFGQLGDGTTIDRNIPVQVNGLNRVIAISTGPTYCLAVKSDGTVWAWGANDTGQLGDNTHTDRHTPVQVSDLTGVIAVAAGGHGSSHSLGLKSDGTVWAWGVTSSGKSNTYSTTPIQVNNLEGIVSIAANSGVCLALKSDSTLWTWDLVEYVANQEVDLVTPFQIGGINGVVALCSSPNLGFQIIAR